VIKAFKILNCRDWGRIDLRVGIDGQIYILDVNPIAGIAPGSWLPNSARFAGFDYPAFINRILDVALDRINGTNLF
jgi:D-alanine-D-alanine ligase